MSQNNFNKNYNRLTEQWIKEFAEEKAGENIVFSPFSLVTLLSIAADATAGKTKDEIEKYLCKSINFKDFREALKGIQDTFTGTDEISTANAVIVKEDLRNTIQPLYEETLRDRFDGKLFLSKCVAEDVNDWEKEKKTLKTVMVQYLQSQHSPAVSLIILRMRLSQGLSNLTKMTTIRSWLFYRRKIFFILTRRC